VEGRGGDQRMISVATCSGAIVTIDGPKLNGNCGSAAIQVNTDCTLVMPTGWDLRGTNGSLDITSSVTAMYYRPGYQSGTATLAATAVHKLGHSSFSANKNAVAQGSIVQSTWTKVTFTTEEWDLGGFYTAADSKWTPPRGPVSLTAQLRWNAGLTLPAFVGIAIYKNGAALKRLTTDVVTANQCMQNIVIFDQCDGDDYYECFVFSTDASAGDKQIDGTIATTFFQGTVL
jgi:hypothetical protein